MDLLPFTHIPHNIAKPTGIGSADLVYGGSTARPQSHIELMLVVVVYALVVVAAVVVYALVVVVAVVVYVLPLWFMPSDNIA